LSKKVEIRLNLPGINAVMKSPEIQKAVQAAGDAVASGASGMDGEAYAATTHLANWIAVTNVFPNSKEAAHSNFRDNTLLKAMGGAGLPGSKEAARRIK